MKQSRHVAAVEGDLTAVKEASYAAKGKALSTTKEGLDKTRSADIEETLHAVQTMPYTQLRL